MVAGHRLGDRPQPAEPLQPAEPIKKSIQPDYLVCLEDGRTFKSLKRHLRAKYNLSPEQYRAIIRSLPEGSCLFLSGPGLESKWLNSTLAAQQLVARGWR